MMIQGTKYFKVWAWNPFR